MLAHTIRFAKCERILDKVTVYFAVFKLLLNPQKLLLSQYYCVNFAKTISVMHH